MGQRVALKSSVPVTLTKGAEGSSLFLSSACPPPHVPPRPSQRGWKGAGRAVLAGPPLSSSRPESDFGCQRVSLSRFCRQESRESRPKAATKAGRVSFLSKSTLHSGLQGTCHLTPSLVTGWPVPCLITEPKLCARCLFLATGARRAAAHHGGRAGLRRQGRNEPARVKAAPPPGAVGSGAPMLPLVISVAHTGSGREGPDSSACLGYWVSETGPPTRKPLSESSDLRIECSVPGLDGQTEDTYHGSTSEITRKTCLNICKEPGSSDKPLDQPKCHVVLGEAPATRCAEGAGRGGGAPRGPGCARRARGRCPGPRGAGRCPLPASAPPRLLYFRREKPRNFHTRPSRFSVTGETRQRRAASAPPPLACVLRLHPACVRMSPRRPQLLPPWSGLSDPRGASLVFFFCAFTPVSYSSGAVNLTWPGVTLPSPFYLFLNVTISLLASEDIKCPHHMWFWENCLI